MGSIRAVIHDKRKLALFCRHSALFPSSVSDHSETGIPKTFTLRQMCNRQAPDSSFRGLACFFYVTSYVPNFSEHLAARIYVLYMELFQLNSFF